MTTTNLVARSIMALTLVIAPVAGVSVGLADAAYAKDGNGGGNGGGGDHGGGHGSGRDGHPGNGKSDNVRGTKDTKASKSDEKSRLNSHGSTSKEKASTSGKAEKVVKSEPVIEPETPGAMPGFSSLNRNYHAYLNSNDPKMAGISAYATAYAEFEAENGVGAVPADPELSDEALRDALASFTKDGVVSDEMVDEAKEILGVGPAVGKIDEIRESLPPADESDVETAQ